MANQVQKSAKRIGGEFKNIFDFLKKVLFKITHLADDTDIEGTIKSIKGGIVLEGSNLWILIFSASIACIGLNVNSPAVIIGAMLISPLMSPILGIGLSFGINDKEYLIKSFYNFGIAVGLSLLTSFIYFKVTPIHQFTDEMKGRISPTILDAGVALFGGLAGIIAGSRMEKTNAIPGVAIATALMPPLCTSGYGLATGDMEVFLGAFYLFFINAVLISISTYVVVRILKFPLVEDTNPEADTRVKSMIFIFVLILLYPSYYFLKKTLDDISRQQLLEDFITTNIHDVKKGVDWEFTYEKDSLNRLEVYYFGEYIKPDSVLKLKEQLQAKLEEIDYKGVCELELTPTDAPPDETKKLMEDRIARLESDLKRMDNKIEMVEIEKDSLAQDLVDINQDTIPFQSIKKELKAFYPEMEEMSIGKLTQTEFDTTSDMQQLTVLIKWDRTVRSYRIKKEKQKRVEQYLKAKLDLKEVQIVSL